MKSCQKLTTTETTTDGNQIDTRCPRMVAARGYLEG
jgi:hypothetical protein